MKTSTIVWIVVIIIVILGGWYWYSSSGATPTAGTPSTGAGTNLPGAGQTNTGQQTVTPVLTSSSNASLGKFVTAANGMTLYAYAKDTAATSNCTGTCATNWPPYTVSTLEPVTASAGIVGTLATITRADGTAQLTYNGHPLYFYAKDTKAGDTSGQGLGGVWSVIQP